MRGSTNNLSEASWTPPRTSPSRSSRRGSAATWRLRHEPRRYPPPPPPRPPGPPPAVPAASPKRRRWLGIGIGLAAAAATIWAVAVGRERGRIDPDGVLLIARAGDREIDSLLLD